MSQNRHFIPPLLPVLLGLALSVSTTSPAMADKEDKERPNFLFILVDDLNDWVGAMGYHPNALTPNIDRLAERGTLFLNAHAAAPLCGPTRAAMMSSLRPSTSGIYGHNNLALLQKNPAISRVPLLPRYFADHGYATLATGKIFHEGAPVEMFDVVGEAKTDYGPFSPKRLGYTPPGGKGTSTDWGAYPESDEEMPDVRYARWTADQLGRSYDQPFALFVGFVRPHVPWTVPQRWFDMHPLEGIQRPPYKADDFDDLPETSRRFSDLPMMPKVEWMEQDQNWEKSVQAYLASVTFVDHCVGTVLDALEESPHADNTIVVLVGDHGYQLGEKGIWAKHTLWERSTRVPLVIARPGDREASRTSKPANHIDLFPTLVELAGLPPVPQHEGTSLAPLLDNPKADGYTASVTTHGYGNHSVRTERWRYIRYEDGAEELYDHDRDPNEWHNLAANPDYAPVVKDLRQHLPTTNAPWVPESSVGVVYNPFLVDIVNRTKAGE